MQACDSAVGSSRNLSQWDIQNTSKFKHNSQKRWRDIHILVHDTLIEIDVGVKQAQNEVTLDKAVLSSANATCTNGSFSQYFTR